MRFLKQIISERTREATIDMSIVTPFERAVEAAPPASPAAPSTSPLDQVFRAHAATVLRWAARLGGPEADHDEIVQEVFIVVERRLVEFRGDGKLTTWLFRITARTVANHLRAARRRRLWAHLTSRVVEDTPSAAPMPGELLEQREAHRRFYDVLDTLPPKYREVLTLFELEELGTEEIARLLDRPHATVRVWLHRARRLFIHRWQLRQQKEAREIL